MASLHEQDFVLTTDDGDMAVFAAHPAGAGRWPVVLFYMDALGIREELRDMVRAIAREGYFCLLPDLYYRTGTVRFDFRRGNAPLMPVARALMGQLRNEDVTRDTTALLAWADAQAATSPGAVGCVGHCMSGRFVLTEMARRPDRMAAGAAFYGTGMVTDGAESPHQLLPLARGEFYGAFGGRDDMIPADMRATLEQALVQAGVEHRIDVFPDAGHGFAFSQRPAYDAEAAQAGWAHMMALFQRRLHGREATP